MRRRTTRAHCTHGRRDEIKRAWHRHGTICCNGTTAVVDRAPRTLETSGDTKTIGTGMILGRHDEGGTLRQLWRRTRSRTLPQICFFCGEHNADVVCSDCANALPVIDASTCPRCRLPSTHGQLCGRCLKRPPVWDTLITRWHYAHPFDSAVLAGKYRHTFSLYRWCAEHLFDAGASWPLADDALLIPVPLAPSRQQARGYNQAALIAHEVARCHDLRVADDALIRLRETGVQQQLNWTERRRNVRGAFAATRPLDGVAVVLVDDVLTTGATLNEAARAVLAAGARRVDALTLARVDPPRRRDRVAKFGRAVA